MSDENEAAKIFDAYVERLGFVRSLGADETARFIAAELAALSSPLLRALPRPHPHLFLLTSPDVRVFCFESAGINFVGVAEGAYLVMFDLFFRMLALPDVFVDVGDPSKEAEPVLCEPPQTTARGFAYRDPAHAYIAPKDIVRAAHAKHLVDTAIFFILAHEYGHIYNGHLGLMREERPAFAYPWFEHTDEQHAPPFDAITRQTLEMDADAFATTVTLQRSITYVKKVAGTSEAIPSLRSGQQVIRAWATATFGLFHTFYGTGVTGKAVTTASHPPTTMRAMNNFAVAKALIERPVAPDVVESPVFDAAVAGALVLVETAYARISGTRVDTSGLHRARSEGELLPLYEDRWAELHPRLEKHALHKLVPIAPAALERIVSKRA